MKIRFSKESLALAVAVIAAVTSLASVVLGTWGAHALERDKWEQTRRDEELKQRNLAIAGFARSIAMCGQETAWLLSKANADPQHFSAEDILAYDKSVKENLAEMVSSLFFVAAYDENAYQALVPLSKQYYEIDGATAAAAVTFRKSPEAGLKQFQSLAERHEEWLAKLPDKIAAVIAGREPR